LNLEGKIILVIGASRGIGAEIAKSLLKKKAKPIALARSPIDYECEYFKFDITDDDSIQALGKYIEKKHKFIEGIVFASAISLPPNRNETQEKRNLQHPLLFNEIITTNLISIYKCVYCLKDLFVENSSIVMISSIGAHLAFPDNPGYQVSKAGLESLARSLAYDLGNKKIRSNSVALGYFKTSMTSASYKNEEMRKKRTKRTILNRWGDPKEVTGAVNFLLSTDSSYVTGTNIVIDGGWSSKGL